MISDKLHFIKSTFGNGNLSRDRENISVVCPNQNCTSNHKNKKKLSIQINTGMTHCWVCGLKSKTLLPVVKKYYNRFVSDYYKIFGDEKHNEIETSEKEEKQLVVPENLQLLGLLDRSSDPDVKASLRYLKKRGIDERDIWYFKFCISSDSRFRRRVIMPSFNKFGEMNFFVSRTIDSDIFLKYVNADVDKTKIIFNEINIDWTKELTITEGPFDLVKCNRNATCLLGSEMGEDHRLFQTIIEKKTPVLLALDADLPEKTQYFARMFAQYDVQVRYIEHDKFKDVGEMTKIDFEAVKSKAKYWTKKDLLLTKINTVLSKSNSGLHS